MQQALVLNKVAAVTRGWLRFSKLIGLILLLRVCRRFLVLYSRIAHYVAPILNKGRVLDLEEIAVDGKSWALVTGSSSGIGYNFAKQLAKKGFNVILVARRKKLLKEICTEIEELDGVKARHIDIDLSTLAKDNNVVSKFTNEVANIVSSVPNSRLALLVCNASFAVLQKDFSDGPLEKNQQLVDLAIGAKVALIQSLLPLLKFSPVGSCSVNNRKSAVITLGALNCFNPSPSFVMSGSTKVFMRYFTKAIDQEIWPMGDAEKVASNLEVNRGVSSNRVVFHMTHPIVVSSEIVSGSNNYDLSTKLTMISPATFVARTLESVELGERESFGGAFHEIIARSFGFCELVMGDWLIAYWFRKDTKRFAAMLQTEVDDRCLDEKLAVPYIYGLRN